MRHLYLSLPVAAIALLSTLSPALGQSITPASDGTGTSINNNGNQINISGGTQTGSNLFHSFQKFGLDAGQVANFLSNPNIANILGRVTGGDASVINGLIQVSGGNSNLYLMNPAGIIFGQNASLNVSASFSATTATGIGFGNNLWFNATGNNNYSALVGTPNQFVFNTSQPGSIVNSGNLAVTPGNNLTLLAGNTVNTGTVTAAGGGITVAAVPGEKLVRISQANNVLSLEVTAPTAADGTALPFTPASLPGLLTGSGGAVTTGLNVNTDGQAVLTQTGTVLPSGSGVAIASGNIDVANSTGTGGTAAVLGDKVGVLAGNINATGKTGGGTVLVGGEFQGKGNVPNASHTIVSSNSTINASATDSGNGGKVIVWANGVTSFDGTILAKGGANAGNGGFVEVSGKETLAYNGTTNTLAPNGQAGTLLLDPKYINIDIMGVSVPPSEQTFNSLASVGVSIFPAVLEAALRTGNVVLQANSDINVRVSVNVNSVANNTKNSLTLQAGRYIDFFSNASLTLNGDFVATVNDPGADLLNREPGTGRFTMGSNSAIITNGGNVNITAANNLAITDPLFRGSSVEINTSRINSGAGNISITATATGSNPAINISSGVLETTTGSITLNGKGGTDYAPGVVISSGLVRTTGGNIDITGQGTGASSVSYNHGVLIGSNSQVNTTGAGNINITGTGGNGISGNNGIFIAGASRVSSVNGNITMTGVGGGIGSNNNGIYISSEYTIVDTGTGAISLKGTASLSGTNSNKGVLLDSGTKVKTSSGALTVEGIAANSGSNVGIELIGNSEFNSASGKLTLTTDEINIIGSTTNNIAGNGILQIQQATPTTGISIGGTFNNIDLNLDDAKIARVAPTFSQVIIGRDNSSGAINLVNFLNAPYNLTIQSPVGAGTINTNGFDLTGARDINLIANTRVTVGKNLSSTAGNINITSNEIDLNGGAGTVSGTKLITLQPNEASRGIDVGIARNFPTVLSLTATDILALKQGFSTILIGRGDSTGIVKLYNSVATGGSAAFKDVVNIAGGNTLIGPDLNNIWDLYGAGSGNLNSSFSRFLTFNNIRNLQGGTANDTFRFNAGGFIEGNINGVDALDTLDYSAYPGPVTVKLGTSTPGTATGVGGTILSIENVIGGATFANSNNLIAPDTVNTWNIKGTNSGHVNGVTFSNFGNLTGGSNNDTFNFDPGGSVSGNINGSSGIDTLDYSKYGSTVNVNLATSTATGIGSKFSSIENLVGNGTANSSTITGSNIANVWNINGTDSGNVAAFTFSKFQNLTGGTNNDTFKFSPASSISGNINGSNGFDTLDYSNYGSQGTVSLATSTATAIGGTFSSIEGFINITDNNTTPPVVVPPVSAPPASAPPVSAPPVSAPPVSAPPVSAPPKPNLSIGINIERENSRLRQELRNIQIDRTIRGRIALQPVLQLLLNDEVLNQFDGLFPEIVAYLNDNGGTISVNLSDLFPDTTFEILSSSESQITIRQYLITRVQQYVGAEYINFLRLRFENQPNRPLMIVEVQKAPKPAKLKGKFKTKIKVK